MTTYKLQLTCLGQDGSGQLEQYQWIGPRMASSLRAAGVTISDLAVRGTGVPPGVCQPVVTVRYDVADQPPHDIHHRRVIEELEHLLAAAGVAALNAAIAQVVNNALQGGGLGAVAGGALGVLTTGPAKRASSSVVIAAIGAAAGVIIGSVVQREVPILVGSKGPNGVWMLTQAPPGPIGFQPA